MRTNPLSLVLLLALAFTAYGQEVTADRTTDTPVVNGDGGAGGGPADNCAGAGKVRPGESAVNVDGVIVNNAATSTGQASIDPKDGCGSLSAVTTVKTKTGFTGDVHGLDGNDVVRLASSNTAHVEGTGGSVSISGGSSITIENTAPSGGGNIVVTLPSGNTADIGPGSSITFNT